MAKRESSATNVRVISLAEKRTFYAFALLYTVMSVVILGILGMLYFSNARASMLSEQRLAMQLEGESYLPRLIKWMQGETPTFPEDPAYETAFYLGSKRLGGELKLEPTVLIPGIHLQGSAVYLVIPMGSYGLNNGKTVMMTEDDGLWREAFVRSFALYGLLLFLVLLSVGMGLSWLFLRPMKAAVTLLDSFIKDTTHELNTPVTAVLTNIEQLPLEELDPKFRKKLLRIETAARAIGSIYDDLTYLLLRQEEVVRDEQIVLSKLVHERLDYFQTRIEAKRLRLEVTAQDVSTVVMDRQKAERLVDNLLSNAVKYSEREGWIRVDVNEKRLRVANRGVSIPREKIEAIFERYVRAESSQGGFGIGLHLVAKIAHQYDIAIDVNSDQGVTKFMLTWPRYTLRSP